MLNRKLVYPLLFTSSILLSAPMMSFATPTSHKDSLPALVDAPEVRAIFNKGEYLFKDLRLNIMAELPAIPANKIRDQYVQDYIARHAKRLETIRERSTSYFNVFDEVLVRYDVPVQLKYLAVVESELNTRALSKAGARGTWQLMPSTARILKLRVNEHVDERTHLYKSTVAAAKYLRDLYRLFDDWLLTVAAYNCGPGPVYKAIKTSGSRNFWKLQHLLPAETRGHVKKFISTHYFFEGKGSMVTLTKAERIHYGHLLHEFVSQHNLLTKDLDKKTNHNTNLPTDPKAEHVVRGNAELHLGPEQQQGLKPLVDE